MAHRGELVNYANRIVGDRAHAEDVVQEAFLRFDAARDGRVVGEPVAYLFRIVRNLAVDVRRGLTRDRNRAVANSEDVLSSLPEDRPSPEAELSARDDLRVLAAAMAELPERTRVALEMHRFGGCKFKEIAAHLGISVGLAHSLVTDGIEHCRAKVFRQ